MCPVAWPRALANAPVVVAIMPDGRPSPGSETRLTTIASRFTNMRSIASVVGSLSMGTNGMTTESASCSTWFLQLTVSFATYCACKPGDGARRGPRADQSGNLNSSVIAGSIPVMMLV